MLKITCYLQAVLVVVLAVHGHLRYGQYDAYACVRSGERMYWAGAGDDRVYGSDVRRMVGVDAVVTVCGDVRSV